MSEIEWSGETRILYLCVSSHSTNTMTVEMFLLCQPPMRIEPLRLAFPCSLLQYRYKCSNDYGLTVYNNIIYSLTSSVTNEASSDHIPKKKSCTDILRKDNLPKENLPNRKFAKSTICQERNFRKNKLPNRQFSEQTFCRTVNLPSRHFC